MQYIRISDTERKKVDAFRNHLVNHGKGKVCLTYIGCSIYLPDELLYRYLVSSNYRIAPACNEGLAI